MAQTGSAYFEINKTHSIELHVNIMPDMPASRRCVCNILSFGGGSCVLVTTKARLPRKGDTTRLLLDTGYAADEDFNRIFGGERKVPPASKKVVAELKTIMIGPTVAARGIKCAICLSPFDEEEETKILPCSHQFHATCILPWLNKVNSCPVCRHELPTDDPEYEEYRKHKARAKQREYELESLHDSMFG